MSVGNSRLIFVAALKYWSNQGGVSSMFKTSSLYLPHQKLRFSDFGTKKSPLRWLSE